MTNKILKNMLLTLGATSLLVVPSIVMASCSTGGSDTKPPVDPGGDGGDDGGTKPPVPPVEKPALNLVDKTISQTFEGKHGIPTFDFGLSSYSGAGTKNGFIGDYNENLIYNLKADIKIDSYISLYGDNNNNKRNIISEFNAVIDLDFSFKLIKLTGNSGIDFYSPVMKYEGNDGEYFDAPEITMTTKDVQKLENGILSNPLDPSFINDDKDNPALNGQKNFQIGFGKNTQGGPLNIMISPAVYKNGEEVYISITDSDDANNNKDKKMTMTYSITPKK